MKIVSSEEFWDRLKRLNVFKASDPEGGSLTKDSLGKNYKCGCGEIHIFTHENTVIWWRAKLSGSFVLENINCHFLNFVRKEGFFTISLNTEYSCEKENL